MICGNCREPMKRLQQACEGCGWTRDSATPRSAPYQQPQRSKHMEAQLHAADYQRRQYKLDARRQDEGDVAYINRIDREATPHILKEHETRRQALIAHQANQGKRVPGEEG